MSLEVSPDDRKWDVTWADSSRAQLVEASFATPAQRLAWLEEAIEFAYRASLAGSAPTAVVEYPTALQRGRRSRQNQ